MKTLFVLKRDPDQTLQTIIQEREKESEVIIIDIRKHQDYDTFIETLAACDQVITW